MTHITLPSTEALQRHSSELTTNEHIQKQAAWQKKVDEITADIAAKEQLLATLHTQADSGDYRTDPAPVLTEEQLALHDRQQELNAEYRQLLIEKIRQAIGALGLRDNEVTVQRYRTIYEYYIGMGEGTIERDATDILCTQGDTVLYALEESPVEGESYAPEGAATIGAIPRGTVTRQSLLNPILDIALARRDVHLTDTDMRSYHPVSISHEADRIIDATVRARIGRLIERGAAQLRQSVASVELSPQPHKQVHTKYEQTYTLDQGATVIVAALYNTDHSHISPLDRQLAGNQPAQELQKLFIKHIDTTGTERDIILDKTYLHIWGGRLELEEAERLMAQIVEERV